VAIKFDDNEPDAQGLPVVSWVENRNLFAPGGSAARVYCFIRPDKKTGALQFVSVGSVRHGEFEEARPWHLLEAFERSSADHLYYSAQDQAALEWLRSKDKTGIARTATADGAVVMLAHFKDERPSDPMHLNCAVATPVEGMLLYDRLTREFITMRPYFLGEKCDGEWIWPKEKPFTAFKPPAPVIVPPWLNWAMNLSIAALFGALGFAFYWFVAR
jgi:hypothetical protein